MQLANDNPDDGIVGPVASGFWHAIADEVERIEHDNRADHPSKKRLSLVSDKAAKADAASGPTDKSKAKAKTKTKPVFASAEPPGDETTDAGHEAAGLDVTGLAETDAEVDDEHTAEHSTDLKHSHRFRRFFVSNFRVVLLTVIAGGLAVALALTSLSLSNKN
jgi:hypothetical protein